MIFYIDSSWLMRVILQKSRAKNLPANAKAYSSVLIHVECRRALDRQFKRGTLNEEQFASASAVLHEYLQRIETVNIDAGIIARAAEAFFIPIHSLDALHLATAMKLSNILPGKLTLLTVDAELATAARAHAFKVE